MWFPIILALVFGPPNPPQPKAFCVPVKAELTEKQKVQYDRIKNAKTTVTMQVVSLRPGVLDPPFPISIGFNENATVIVRDYKVKKAEDKLEGKVFKSITIDWEENASQGILVITNGNASGLIYFGKTVYSLESLGNGLHVLVEIDQTKFPKENSPMPPAKED
jgi:hypothetical protein